MSPRHRIAMCGGPCGETYLTAGGLSGAPPRALWAVRDADGDVGCIAGEVGRPPGLAPGEAVLGCYEYDAMSEAYTWRPAPCNGWRRGLYPDDHPLER
jgi:hypothetical protein